MRFDVDFCGLDRGKRSEFEPTDFGTGVEEGVLHERMVVKERFYAVKPGCDAGATTSGAFR